MTIEMYIKAWTLLLLCMLTVPTPAGIGSFSHTLTLELFGDLSYSPLLSPQDGATLFPVVRLLGERRCQEAG